MDRIAIIRTEAVPSTTLSMRCGASCRRGRRTRPALSSSSSLPTPISGGWWRLAQLPAVPGAVRVTDGEPTASVTAPVVDLALWAWTRGGSVEISGDSASVAALDAVVSNGMQ
jgi:hypothetical protein